MADLAKIVAQTVAITLEKFSAADVRADEFAVTMVDLCDEKNPVWADHRGAAPVYPASVVKLFYLVAAHQQMEDGVLADTAELRRALRDMIVDSGNEATGFVLDLLTDTTSGPELSPAELLIWHEKRNAVNRYFHARGFPEINANRKTWHDGPYGRDRQAVEQFMPARNSLTSIATARLLVEIATGQCVSAARSEQMLELLRRDFANREDHQACEFIGAALSRGTKLWSKAGYMSKARHDAALLEFADGKKFVLVIFTENHSSQKEIIPAMARLILDGLNQSI